MSEGCPICADNGMRIEEHDGSRFAVECECRQAKRTQFLLQAAGIPERYQHCTFENFNTSVPTSSRTLQSAAIFAKKFVEQSSSRPCLKPPASRRPKSSMASRRSRLKA